jgi:steroid delta-isomerase-like uncharacterized protein
LIANAEVMSLSDLDTNKQVIERFVREVLQQGSKPAVDELVAPDFTSHSWPSTGDGRADLKAAIERVAKGLADSEFVIEDTIAEGDRVVVRLTSSATQVGEFMGMPASGKRYSIGEIHIFRLRDGQLVEQWDQIDVIGMMKQLGAMPSAGGGASAND